MTPWHGVEPTTARSEVQRPNRCATDTWLDIGDSGIIRRYSCMMLETTSGMHCADENITQLVVVVCGLHVPKIIKFYLRIQMLPAKM